jgi:hypothetical protein
MTFASEWQVAMSIEPWLLERGYELVESRGPEGMAQGLRRYSGLTGDVLVVADRGQWFIDVRPSGAPSGRYDFGVWSITLGAPVKFHTDEWALDTSWQLQPQLDYLRSHLAEIEAACLPERRVTTMEKLLKAQRATEAFPAT